MVSGMGSILIFFYVTFFSYCLLIRDYSKLKWGVFNAAIIVNIFFAFGTAIGGVSYILFSMFIYDITALVTIVFGQINYTVPKKMLLSSILLVFFVIFSFINLFFNQNLPQIIPMDTSMDSVYYGIHYLETAQWSPANKSSVYSFILMCVGLFLSKEYFQNEANIDKLMKNIIKAFNFFFIIILIEFFINNLVSPNILREAVLNIIGNYDDSKVWVAENRFGYYGVTAFFPEQSYISVVIIYISIIYIRGIENLKQMIFYVFSVLSLLISGSTTGIMLLPLSLFVYYKKIINPKKTIRRNMIYFSTFFTFSFVLIGLVLVFNYRSDFISIYDTTILKINAFLNGGDYSTKYQSSGAIRNYGNMIAINAFFKSPWLGVGIGTTRGYGILSGFLATFGIVGILSYLFFLSSIFNFSIKGKKLLLLIILGYFSVILSVWYSYYFALIPVYALFSSNYKPSLKECSCVKSKGTNEKYRYSTRR